MKIKEQKIKQNKNKNKLQLHTYYVI